MFKAISFWWDPITTVSEIIEQWHPASNYTKESDYRDSLAKELRRNLGSSFSVVEEYGSEKQKIDIVVNDKIPIELKANLSRSGVQRTIGQMVEYLRRWDYLILALCGKISEGDTRSIEKFIEEQLDFYGNKRVKSIYK